MLAVWHIQTPPGRGAIAAVLVHGDVDRTLRALHVAPIAPGRVALRMIPDLDNVVIARWSDAHAHIMPHGGSAILRALTQRLDVAGLTQAADPHPRQVYPEARDDLEAVMLAAVARAASPLAVDLLLHQPERWRGAKRDGSPINLAPASLDHLLAPPLVVLVGRPNIGKSTLVNTLAQRAVSIVADEPGTTRDHVGVMLDLGGLVVRFVDAPGLVDRAVHRGDGAADIAVRHHPDEHAQALALNLAMHADLLVVCGDASAAPPTDLPHGPQRLRIALRRDLGEAPWTHDAAVSAADGTGVRELAALLRETLAPRSALESSHPWAFWRALGLPSPV